MSDRIDIAEFRVLVAEVIRHAQPHVDGDLLMVLARSARDACEELEAHRDTRRERTRTLIRDIARLDRRYSDMDSGARQRRVCSQLDIGKSRYYELRRAAELDHAPACTCTRTETCPLHASPEIESEKRMLKSVSVAQKRRGNRA